ncbi:MAG: VOC family protein [Pirellulaceae bacterium]|nr:VOC family protein [Pirellulaceae bacterium]
MGDHSQNPPCLPPIAMNLLVIEVREMVVAMQFYESLGLVFELEQHGRGPQHYSAKVGSTIFEIYPRDTEAISARVRLGFEVASLDKAVNALRSRAAKVLKEPGDSPWGRRAVVEDPDGNRVELLERVQA